MRKFYPKWTDACMIYFAWKSQIQRELRLSFKSGTKLDAALQPEVEAEYFACCLSFLSCILTEMYLRQSSSFCVLPNKLFFVYSVGFGLSTFTLG